MSYILDGNTISKPNNHCRIETSLGKIFNIDNCEQHILSKNKSYNIITLRLSLEIKTNFSYFNDYENSDGFKLINLCIDHYASKYNISSVCETITIGDDVEYCQFFPAQRPKHIFNSHLILFTFWMV